MYNTPYNRNSRWFQQPDPTLRPTYPIPRPKVVQIPVRFVNSELSASASALKIQKVLRGFMVRKNMKRIKEVKKQVDEIEEKLSRNEVVESIRSNDKERLRIGETLMSLLLKLDSIRGVDMGVRDCRKSVIRKAIALQERIDSIVVVAADSVLVEAETETETTTRDQEAEQLDDESREEMEAIADVGVDCEVKVSSDCVEEEGIESDGKNRELLMERIMKDNEKMMSMMSQLFERNEKQMKMLSALTNRVELLERAFLCEKLSNRRKKMNKMNKDRRNGCGEE